MVTSATDELELLRDELRLLDSEDETSDEDRLLARLNDELLTEEPVELRELELSDEPVELAREDERDEDETLLPLPEVAHAPTVSP